MTRLHNRWIDKGKPHGGIVFVTSKRPAIGSMVRGLVALHAEVSSEQMENAIH